MNDKIKGVIKYASTYGAILGLVLTFLSILLYVSDILKTSFFVSFFFILLKVVIIIVFVALITRHYRNKVLGGYISFVEAFLLGLYIIVGASIITGFYDLVLNTIIDPDYMVRTIEATKEQAYDLASKYGVPEAQIEDTFQTYDSQLENYSPLRSFFASLMWATVLGSILSLITASLFKKEKSPFGEN